MSNLFISHSSSDNEAARELEQQLDGKGHRSVFLDVDPEQGIAAGQSWERTLYAKLRACRAVIVLCTDRYLASHWCFAEIALARMEGKHIFTLLVDPYSGQPELPSILTEQQYIDLRTNREDGLQRLWRGFKEKGIEAMDARNWNLNDPPYPGLMAFEEPEAAIFFGREKEIDEGVELLNRSLRVGYPRLIMMLGASGSGKSSLVRAGLLPRLRRDAKEWLVLGPIRPGQEPARELAMALGRAFEQVGHALPWQAILAQLQPADSTRAEQERENHKPETDSGSDVSEFARAVRELEDRLPPGANPQLLRYLQLLRDATELPRAGTLPANAPQDHTLAALSAELLRHSGRSQGRILLVIDQFEELLGHAAPDHAANRFLALLREALEAGPSPVLVLAAMRSDYLDILQHNRAFQGLDFKSLTLGPLSEQGLRAVIEAPAELGAIKLEKGLTERLLADTGTADALPLLAFTLRVLWDRFRDDRKLEIHEYLELGGLQGAMAKEADAVFEAALRLGKEDDLRDAFLKLARLTEDGMGFARQPVRWDELPEAVRPMLRHFVDNRLLLSRGDGTVEVTHEALFRSWERLRGWLEESREFLRWRRRLQEARKEWERTGRDAGALWSGARLSEAERWRKQQSDLGPDEQDFIRRSLKRKRNLRLAASGLVVVILLGVAFAWWADQDRMNWRVASNIVLAKLRIHYPQPKMVALAGGTFQMGSPDSDELAPMDEHPQHSVTLKPFLLGKYEVSFDEYDVFARIIESEGGCINGHKTAFPPDESWGRESRPVIRVSAQDAACYAEWLSRHTGKHYRLPTEAEWEYAARAGTQTAYWWGDEVGKNNANCDGCGSQWDNQQTAPVGSFPPNRFGMHDMAGNVWEWVQDNSHDNYVGAPEDGAAWKLDSNGGMVIRGGAWDIQPGSVRSAIRGKNPPDSRGNYLGFRLAQDP